MNRKPLPAIVTLALLAIPVAAFAAEAESPGGFWQALAGIGATLAAAAVGAAVKSWSDVNVLKVEIARLAKDVDEAAEASHVTAALERIEKRLDRFEGMLTSKA